ncbi:MAG: FecR domain-containing protein, partial [Verrucomicrobiales bacterium]
MKTTLFFLTVHSLSAATAALGALNTAKVSEIVRSVEILRPPTYQASAKLGDIVSGQTTVRTGIKSRTQLTFPDQTLLRLGSNTQFSFQDGDSEFTLTRGTAVLKTTKASGGARIRTGAGTAAITGSMAAFTGPEAGNAGVVKLLLYYGTAALEVGGKTFNLKPWQMAVVPVDANGVARPEDVRIFWFDAALNAQTSKLVDPDEDVLAEHLAQFRANLSGSFLASVTTSTDFAGVPSSAIQDANVPGNLPP